MVVLNRIYTRTCDDRTTALGIGARRTQYDLRVAAYITHRPAMQDSPPTLGFPFRRRKARQRKGGIGRAVADGTEPMSGETCHDCADLRRQSLRPAREAGRHLVSDRRQPRDLLLR